MCPISPTFIIFLEEAITILKKGIKIWIISLYCIRFADDTALVADTEDEMNSKLIMLKNISSSYDTK